MWNVARKEWKLLLKEKGLFFWLIVLPIAFIVLFGTIFNGAGNTSLKISYIDLDQTTASRAFIQAIEDAGGYKMVEAVESEMADKIQQIRDGKETVLLVIPRKFGQGIESQEGKQTSVTVYRDAAAKAAAGPLLAILENLANGYRDNKVKAALQATGRSKSWQEQVMAAPFRIDDRPENALTNSSISQYVPGYTVMFVFFVIISMIRRFMSDKESGMIARMRSTTIKPISYLAGMWLAYLAVALIQCTVLLLFGHWVYGLQLGDITAIALLVFALALCGTGLGLALSMLVRSENQGMALTQLLTMGGAVLGGLWFPIDLMPSTMRAIGHFTPQFWAQKAFQDIIVRGMHTADIWQSLLVLAAVALAGLAVALLRFKAFLKTALG
ncbi:ABC transporter permease [Brevibacillus aydinogluensis]|uniref:ABC transporter permease n=1 Tax=Brevibacillus aydinogluensis TaxID=927786 RepID=A0AA48RI12_9BACL|nr:ABC transporter permease [Brevibacillus aydinogluensis]CAJ1003318.1 ABC transporter permease [Brevibacillus aydinogluensis]